MFELTQDFWKVDAGARLRGFGPLLGVPSVATAGRGRDEPILAQDRERTLHGHSRDLEPSGQVLDGAHMGPGRDGAVRDATPSSVLGVRV